MPRGIYHDMREQSENPDASTDREQTPEQAPPKTDDPAAARRREVLEKLRRVLRPRE